MSTTAMQHSPLKVTAGGARSRLYGLGLGNELALRSLIPR